MIWIWGKYIPQKFKYNLNYCIGSYGHMYTRLSEIKKYHKVDVLFLGSSHTYRGFDVRIFKKNNIDVFNLGSSAQSPIQTKVLLERYLDKVKPKTIIYEVFPETFSADGVESALDIISNDRNDISSLKMALDINHIKVYNTLIYGEIMDLFNSKASYKEPLAKDEDIYISGGFVERKISFFKHSKYKTKIRNFNNGQFTAFNEIVSMIKEKNINLILVNAPITSALYNSYTDNKIFDKKMKQYGNYYNFNKMVMLDDSLHFYDSNHLNQLGVEVFNKKLIESINLKE